MTPSSSAAWASDPVRMSLRRQIGAAALVVATLMLGACTAAGSAEPTARPVTQEEAERLAAARSTTYDQRWVDFEANVPSEAGALILTGRADMQSHTATAVMETADDRWALLQWTAVGKALTALPGDPGGLPDPPPSDGWQVVGLDLEQPLDTALAVILNLASDQPEDPAALRENGAEWVGTDTVDGTDVDVLIAPGTDGKANEAVRYYVDADGNLRRLTADTGGAEPLQITLSPSEGREIPIIPDLAARGG